MSKEDWISDALEQASRAIPTSCPSCGRAWPTTPAEREAFLDDTSAKACRDCAGLWIALYVEDMQRELGTKAALDYVRGRYR